MSGRNYTFSSYQPNTYPFMPFGPSRPLLTRSVARPLTPTTLPALTPMSRPQPLLYFRSVALSMDNGAVDRHELTCTKRRRSEPIFQAPRPRLCRLSWAIPECKAFEDPIYPQWSSGSKEQDGCVSRPYCVNPKGEGVTYNAMGQRDRFRLLRTNFY